MVREPRPRSSGGDGPLPDAKRMCTSGSAAADLVLDDLPGVDLVLDDPSGSVGGGPATAPAGSPAGSDGCVAAGAADAAAPPAPPPSPPPLGLMGLPDSVLSTIIDAMDVQTRVRFGRTCTAAAAAALSCLPLIIFKAVFVPTRPPATLNPAGGAERPYLSGGVAYTPAQAAAAGMAATALARYGDAAFARRYVNYRPRVRRKEPHCAATLRAYVDAATTGRRPPFWLPDVPLSLSVAASLFRVPPTVAPWAAAAVAVGGRPTPCHRGHYVDFVTVLRMVATTAGTPDALTALAPRLHGNANAAADRSERSCLAQRTYRVMRYARGLEAAPWDTLMLAPLHASPATVAFLAGRRGSSAAAVGAAADRLAAVYAVLPRDVAMRVRAPRSPAQMRAAKAVTAAAARLTRRKTADAAAAEVVAMITGGERARAATGEANTPVPLPTDDEFDDIWGDDWRY